MNKVITAPSAQQIVNACYDSPDLNNQFCGLFSRVAAGATGPNGEEQYRILEGTLQQTVLNYAKYKVRGIDTEISYRHSFDGLGTLTGRFVYTHVFQRSNYTDPSRPNYENQILLELGDPRNSWNLDLGLKTGPVTLGYQLRFIGRMFITGSTAENFISLQGRAPENPDYSDRALYKAVTYNDFRVGFDASDKFNIYLGVDNALNKLPPLGLTGIGDGSGIYDTRGRFMYAGVVAKF